MDEFDSIIQGSKITPVYQPIVELTSSRVVGYEALARGPAGSELESPLALFHVAAEQGRTSELDWLCRAAAFRGALDMELYPPFSLFVNFHPDSLAQSLPHAYEALWERAQAQLGVVVEVTEQSLLDAPAEMLRNLHRMRQRGWLIALDDVGVHSASLALLPFVEPDIIKMDMRLVRQTPTVDLAEIVAAANAHAEATGALILAEGIENDEHVLQALSIGAVLGQGWRWGRPAPLPEHRATPPSRLPQVASKPYRPAASIFARLARDLPARPVSRPVLAATSELIEQMALRSGQAACLFSTYNNWSEWQSVADVYDRIAQSAALVAVYAPDAPPTDTTSLVRSGRLGEDDPMCEEWCTVLLSPHQSAALVARPVDDHGGYECIVTYDRGRVREAAQALMARLV